jgi:MSHA biogenesis protein MshG
MKFPRSPLSARAMASLCRRLAYITRGGIPAARMFELIAQEPGGRRIKRLARGIAEEIRDGMTLEEALRARATHFSSVFIELVSVGERTGKLDTVIADLADWYETEVELQRRFALALAYPVAVYTVILYILYPLIHVLFTGAPTSLLYWAVFCLARDIVILFVLWEVGFLSWLWANVGSRLWPFAGLSRKMAMSRFCEAFALMLESGISVTTSIRTAAAVPGRPYLEKELLRAIPRIQQGATIDEAFSECPSLPPLVRGMISVGEQTGELEQSLQKARQYMKDEAVHGLKTIAVTLAGLGILLIIFLRGLSQLAMLPLRW